MIELNRIWQEEGRPVDMARPEALPQPVPAPETEHTKRMKSHFGFFGGVTLLYAFFYAFCMFHNGSGVTFPFFVAASLLYFCSSLAKLEITLQKGSGFYMAGMMLLAVSTFCTDDGRIIAMNKTAIFLLMMSLMLKHFCNTAGWQLGKYVGAILNLVFNSLGEVREPFEDAKRFFRESGRREIGYVVLGLATAVPVLAVVIALLAGADAVFRNVTNRMLAGINAGSICDVLLRIALLFLACYLLTAYLCRHRITEEVKDHRSGEPIVAIIVTALLTLVYLLFCGIQFVYLFLGKMRLPAGYTYAQYAREGFFQLLAVSLLNLLIVLVCRSLFRKSKVLQAILTLMSFCTFIMIASSAFRMMIYIQYYYVTFLRIFVLWSLAVLFFLFAGIVASIFRETFPLFGYSVVVLTVLYLGLSFSHPDYIIARINTSNMAHSGAENDFFKTEAPYHDYGYLAGLSADAAPVLVPLLEENDSFASYGEWYLERMGRRTENFGVRTFNVSRFLLLEAGASVRR